MRIRILGDVEVEQDGRLMPLGGPRQTTVLCALALNRGRAVPVDRLTQIVWGDQPPSTARTQIQICVSKLRRVVGVPIESNQVGYTLHVDHLDLDLAQFESLVTRSQAQPSPIPLLRQALELWRGPALGGVEALRPQATRLDELRLRTTVRLMDAELAEGRHRELIGELRELTHRHPLHESLHGRLMLALFRAQRQADALDTFRTLQSTLSRDLGVEPGAELRELHQRMLRRDRTLAPGRAVPEQPPRPPLVGRGAAIMRVGTLLRAQHRRSAPIVIVSGAAGTGKTALADEISRSTGDAFTDGVLRLTFDADLHAHHALGLLLEQTSVPAQEIPVEPRLRRELWHRISGRRRFLLILEDVRMESQVRPLVPAAGSAVLVTSRRRLTALDADLVELSTLDLDEGVALLGSLLGSRRVTAEPEAARTIVTRCAGLPVALVAACRRLPAGRSLTRLADRLSDEGALLDELGDGVRRLITETVFTAPPAARRALRLLSLRGRQEFTEREASMLLRECAEPLLESLVDARLLEVLADGYRIPPLVRLVAREFALENAPRPVSLPVSV
ncbi:AAA family ATPase [Pseudonocardiaceae bacterium YIM PH 21723]|nr:AAA family ATPase [Pseudonocardiaceae bacterium YIM PH 21723]